MTSNAAAALSSSSAAVTPSDHEPATGMGRNDGSASSQSLPNVQRTSSSRGSLDFQPSAVTQPSDAATTHSASAAAIPSDHVLAASMKRDDGSASSQSLLLAMQPTSSRRCSPAFATPSTVQPPGAATVQSGDQASTQDAQDGAHNRSLAAPGAVRRAHFEPNPMSGGLCRPSAAHLSLGTASFAFSGGTPSTVTCSSGTPDYSAFDKISPGLGKMMAESQAACEALLSSAKVIREPTRCEVPKAFTPINNPRHFFV